MPGRSNGAGTAAAIGLAPSGVGVLAVGRKAYAEERRAPRHRTLIGATIVHGDDMRTVECTVRDSSENGRKVRLPPLTILPELFWLLEHRTPLANEAKLRWRQENNAGLELLGHCELEVPTSPVLRLLHGIWAEKAPR